MSTDVQTRHVTHPVNQTQHVTHPVNQTQHVTHPINQTRHATHQPLSETAPAVYQAIKLLTAFGIGATLTVLSGLTLTGTVLAVILATPLLVLFSPVLVPAAVIAVLSTGGFVVSGVFGVAALAALAWLYVYAMGKQPEEENRVDYERRRKMMGKAKETETGQYGVDKGQQGQHQSYTYSS